MTEENQEQRQEVSCVEKPKTEEEVKKELEVRREGLKKFKPQVLSGKSPVYVFANEGKVQWDLAFLKDSLDSVSEAFKLLTNTTNSEIATDIINKGKDALPGREEGNPGRTAGKYNIVFQALADSQPKDATEARLCLQANALYSHGMDCLFQANNQDRIPQGEHWFKHAQKLLRLHNETVEALTKYRRGGEQRVVVQHVNVSEGGQAVVGGGDLIAGGGGK